MKKPILNFSVDAMEPLLGAVSSFLISSELCFQLRDPIFGGTQPMRKPLRCVQCVSAVLFSEACGSLHQLQNRLPCFVDSASARTKSKCRGDGLELIAVVTPPRQRRGVRE